MTPQNPLPRYAVSDDEEMSEVLDTDTDTDPFSISPFPLLSQTSMSSIDSNVEPSTSFSSCKSPTAGGTGGSPRKYRKTDPSPSKSARIEAIKDGIASRNASQTALKSPISPPKSALLKKIEDEFTSQCNTSQSPMPVSPTPLRSFSFGASSSTNASRDNLKTRLTGKSSFTAPPRPLLSTASSPSRKDPDLQKFLMQPLGQDLESCIIAHDKATVALMDRHQLSWGVQWELARGVTDRFWDWAKVHKKLEQLTGLNSEAAWKVRAVMLGRQPRASEISLWEELDREQKAIEENLGRGLGLMGAYEGKKDWYGGQIQQRARIILGDGDQLRVRLEKLEKRRSYRLARFSGSRRVLQVGVPKELVLNQNKTLKDFLRQKFVLLGRIFVPFYAKDHAVYLVETDENYERQSGNWCGDQFRRSFKDILNWHNRLDLNIDQPITKYASRNALPLSTSVPILEFADEDINFIDDICEFI
ncbi:hypothetical protein H0H92_002267 [Tricholoma furcatifolium]|nr:hypothetical protein H0H92_002267 [Tricholoma furcatifolium]